MDAQNAINIIALRGDRIAQKLGVDEVPNWRNITGTAHLYIRGAFQSLERIVNEERSTEAAHIAMSTVSFAIQSTDGFLGDNSEKAAKIAEKILTCELSAGFDVFENISSKDIDLLVSDLEKFTQDISNSANDSSTIAFKDALIIAYNYYKSFAEELKPKLSSKQESNIANEYIKRSTTSIFFPQ